MKSNPALLFAALAAMLPGDHIHHQASISRDSQTSADRVAAIEAAERKRNRKNAKRKANG